MCPKLTALVLNDGTPISDDWIMDGSRAYFVKAIQQDPRNTPVLLLYLTPLRC